MEKWLEKQFEYAERTIESLPKWMKINYKIIEEERTVLKESEDKESQSFVVRVIDNIKN